MVLIQLLLPASGAVSAEGLAPLAARSGHQSTHLRAVPVAILDDNSQ
jgi:hypothetical protein